MWPKRPFVNIMLAVLREGKGGQALNEGPRLATRTAIAVCTITGAKALMRSDLFGSIKPGKRADMIRLDRTLIDLAKAGMAIEIADTEGLGTLFDGTAIHDTLDAR